MLKFETLRALSRKLDGLLFELLRGEIDCIEYGDPAHIGGFLSHLRIYYMSTAGGVQFCIKQISSHVEGSGWYSPHLHLASDEAMNAIIHYRRPLTHLPKVIQDRRKNNDLTFFPLLRDEMAESQNKGRNLVLYRLRDFAKDAEVVSLDKPAK